MRRVICGILVGVLLLANQSYCANSLIPESQLKTDASVNDNSISNPNLVKDQQYKFDMSCYLKKQAYWFGGEMIGIMIGVGCYRLANGKPEPGDLTGMIPMMVYAGIGATIGVLIGNHYADKLDCYREKKVENP